MKNIWSHYIRSPPDAGYRAAAQSSLPFNWRFFLSCPTAKPKIEPRYAAPPLIDPADHAVFACNFIFKNLFELTVPTLFLIFSFMTSAAGTEMQRGISTPLSAVCSLLRRSPGAAVFHEKMFVSQLYVTQLLARFMLNQFNHPCSPKK